MLEHGKISSWQVTLLIVPLIAPTAVLSLPAFTAKLARQDAWLSIAVAILVAMLISWLIVGLSLRFPGKNLFEYPELILGKTLGKIIAFIYVLWLINFEMLVYGEFGLFLLNIMPATPVVVKHIVAASLAAYIARNGLEVMCRVNQLFLPLFLLSFIAIVALSANDMETARLLPVYDRGMLPILKGAIAPVAWLGGIVVLAVLIPYLNKPQQAMRAAIVSTLMNGSIIIVAVLFTIGHELTSNFIFSAYDAVRTISIANFLERLDSVVVLLWTIEGFIKISLLRYSAALGTAQCLGLKDYRQLVLPIGVIVIAGSLLMYEGAVRNVEFLSKTIPFFSLTFEVGVPLLLLIIALFRGMEASKG